jgi:hypothetical protein
VNSGSVTDTGVKKLPTEIEKIMKFCVLECWMFFFRGFSYSLEVLHGGLGIKKNCNFNADLDPAFNDNADPVNKIVKFYS